MKKHTIAYILEKFPSPTEYFILNEILQLEKRGMDIIVLVLRKQKRYMDIPEVLNLRSSVIYLPNYVFYFPFLSLILYFFTTGHNSVYHSMRTNPRKFSLYCLVKQIRNYGISRYFSGKLKSGSVIHVHAHFAFIGVEIAQILSGMLKTKYSFTAHAQDIYTNETSVKSHTANAAFVITCTGYNNKYIDEITENRYHEKIYKVYHGIDVRGWSSVSGKVNNNNCFHILSVARLVEKKGLLYLIKAVEILKKENIDVQCKIIGEGPLEAELKSYISSRKLNDVIQLSPFVTREKIKDLLSQSDVFVLPCIIAGNGDRDGLPNVVVEAMLSNVPVITTPVSALPEAVINKVTGLLVKEKSEKDIADAIKLLINNKALYSDIITNARKKIVDEFDIETCTNQLAKILQSNVLTGNLK